MYSKIPKVVDVKILETRSRSRQGFKVKFIDYFLSVFDRLWVRLKHSLALYQSHMSELTKALADQKKSTLVEVAMQALANVIRWDPKLAMSTA